MKTFFRDTQIYFTVSGKGPVIVWLHGFLESKEIWEKQCVFFNSKFTNVCIDLLGHGKTACIAESHTMELQAEAVEAVLKHLKTKQFLIVGHSMGGYVGLALLEKLGCNISHFVLLNSTSNPDTQEKKLNRERAIKIVAKQKDSFVRMGIINLFSETNKKQYCEDIENLIKNAQSMSVQGITAALEGMKNRSSKVGTLRDYQGKKLIVCGIDDPVISIETSEEESKLTESKLLQLKGGHMSYLEVMANCNEGLARFFAIDSNRF